MKRRIVPAVLALMISSGIHAGESKAGSPPRLTPSASSLAREGAPFQAFAGWLEALNSGDRARLAEFLRQRYPGATPESFDRLQFNSDGLELRALESASENSVAGLVQERNSDNFLRFDLALTPGASRQIESLEILYVPRPEDFPPPRLSESEIFAALDAKLSKDAASGRFSGAVLVTRHGKVEFSAVHGLANREKNIANTLETRFDIGSMSKMFTATAIMQLVQAGKVELTAPLGKYLPDYPNKDIATKVTIEHLLTHRGGTGNIFGPEFDAHRLELRTHADYVKLFGARGPAFEPGSRFEYSNYGMVLLGVVIERVTGQSYFDYVEKHVFRPAKMTRTATEPIDALLPGTATGYMRGPDGVSRPNAEVLAYRGSAGGGAHSTVRDLARFADALTANKLLKPANTQRLITGKVLSGNGQHYAYGFVNHLEDAGWVGHDGGGPGLSGILQFLPDSGYVVVVLANMDPPFAGRIGNYVTLRLVNRRR